MATTRTLTRITIDVEVAHDAASSFDVAEDAYVALTRALRDRGIEVLGGSYGADNVG